MRITEFKIKNFKCIGPEPITLDFTEDILVLIGQNNVGKSSVLRALDFYFSGTKTLPEKYFYNHQHDQDHAVVIELKFSDLSSQDRVHQAVSPYISTDNSWILRKSYYYDSDGGGKCDYAAIVDGAEKKNPAGLTQNCDNLFVGDKMQKIFVEAVKDVSDVVEGKSKSTFGQIFSIILKNAVEATSEYTSLLDALRAYQNLFRGAGQLSQITQVENTINERLARIISASSKIDTESPQVEKFMPAPKLLTDDGRGIDIDPTEQGHGLQRALIFVLLELLAETTSPMTKEVGPRNLLMIEEPEIYMHPQMLRKIADTLYEIASQGKAQVICTTHSPIFIRIAEKQKALARFVRKEDNSLTVFQQKTDIFSGAGATELKKQLQMITNFDPAVNELFFARRVVLLEGDTELAVFREAPNLLFAGNKNNLRDCRDTTVINCRGRNTIPLFQEILNHFQIPYVVIHDTEGEDKTSGINGKILGLLGGDESKRKMFSPNIEDGLGITDRGGNKSIKALDRIQELNGLGQLEGKIGSYIRFAYNIP
ncbi:MAG: AAA family ATPase [Minisyncoccia bacterium]|jgi:predicted ATP-dependent endonuclease of OLD family